MVSKQEEAGLLTQGNTTQPASGIETASFTITFMQLKF
jgi:hypothetical protein